MIINITVLGIVQGVGFRPFIANLAQEFGINGSVLNCGGVVKITAQASQDLLNEFIRKIKNEPPLGSHILKVEISEAIGEELTGFHILSSEESTEETPILPPDFPVCDNCLKELNDKENRRYNYPFISCTSCGPRYSIIESIPYDRHTTSMSDFKFCKECLEEYTGNDRRRHAQTISCHECGPQLILRDSEEKFHYKDGAFKLAVNLLKTGKIIAIKGIGGYQFACSPYDELAVENLRLLKHRDKKPFAVMFSCVDDIKKSCKVEDDEEKLLTSQARPIVLLEKKSEIFCRSVSEESRYIGAFLPYTPLHKLLIDECGELIMTSANLSSEPIISNDDEMLSLKSPYLSGVLYNKRRIVTSLDDSVARIINGSYQLIRRSRGYVPLPLIIDRAAENPILALGSDLKSSFCLMKDDRVYPSQYFGDMEDYGVYNLYNKNLKRMQDLFRIYPKLIACDLHPDYYTTKLASTLAHKSDDIRIIKIQHHHAHIASVMAENKINSCIGVAFDGTGYGSDGTVWGGEFLLCNNQNYERFAFLQPVKLCGGDNSSKDAFLSLLCNLYDLGLTSDDSRFPLVKAALKNDINTYFSSSAGRLFDTVSAILGIRDFNSYEGECAVALENLADYAIKNDISPYPLKVLVESSESCYVVSRRELILSILDALACGADKSSVALGFHIALAKAVHEVCTLIRSSSGENRVALSGGVFANLLFTQECIKRLEKESFEVYINRDVPANDGGICLGQAWIAAQM